MRLLSRTEEARMVAAIMAARHDLWKQRLDTDALRAEVVGLKAQLAALQRRYDDRQLALRSMSTLALRYRGRADSAADFIAARIAPFLVRLGTWFVTQEASKRGNQTLRDEAADLLRSATHQDTKPARGAAAVVTETTPASGKGETAVVAPRVREAAEC